jgi:hypothetical protein
MNVGENGSIAKCKNLSKNVPAVTKHLFFKNSLLLKELFHQFYYDLGKPMK